MGHAVGLRTPHTLPPNFGRVAGVNASGAPVKAVSAEYEVCFKCHAEASAVKPTIARRIPQNNTRRQFSPDAVSYHPVEAPGRNSLVPSLRPGLTVASTISCSSCHNSGPTAPGTGGAVAAAGGGASAPGAVHGSNYPPLLAARYDTADFSTESAQAYALCYACHDRASILSDQSFKGHRRHIVDLRAPCAACHDAHGIPSGQGSPTANSNLINFAAGIVLPDKATNRLEFHDTGMFSGECFLSCHGASHSPKRYP